MYIKKSNQAKKPYNSFIFRHPSSRVSILIGFLTFLIVPLLQAGATMITITESPPANEVVIVRGTTTISTMVIAIPSIIVPRSTVKKVWITAYTSTPEETDDTPFITASGKTVRDGIVATNLLPFGSKIKIPALFGNRIFIVEDRMHDRKKNNVDVWMESKSDALRFGANYTEILILNSDKELVQK